jgi:signal transduction histidine kinase
VHVSRDELVDGPALPLLVRGVLLAVGAGLLSSGVDPATALGPSLALLIIVAFAAIPLPGTTGRVLQAFAEAALLALVIGSIGEDGGVFLPLLLLSVFTAGQRGGLVVGAAAGFVGSLSWSLGILSTTSTSQLGEGLREPLLWAVLLLATGSIGGWVRRLTLENRTYSDSAYEDAFRLLTELQEVARNLSLGLDPTTLGHTLVDAVGELAPGTARTLSVRTGEGRLAPLVGTPGARDELLSSEEAWLTGDRVSTTTDDGTRHDAFPVRMGQQVVAVLGVSRPADAAGPAAPEVLDEIERAVGEVGPKLAAALVFDEVRQLATVDERLRLAREIHDGVAQELASVGYMLDDLAGRVPEDAADELRALRSHVRRVVGELRLSIFDLRSGVDDSIGLGTALSEHVQRVGQQSDLVVHTVLDEHGERLPAGHGGGAAAGRAGGGDQRPQACEGEEHVGRVHGRRPAGLDPDL